MTRAGLAAIAALLLGAAPASAAPDHTFAGGLDPESFEGTSLPGTGLSDLSEQLGCNDGVNCDQMLFEVKEFGVLTIQTTGNEPTLVDGDFEVFFSDANGTVGESAAPTTTSFSPNENSTLDVEPGFYLMRWYYSGAGTYDGNATWSPPPPPEDEEAEE